jgi:type III secretory pathway lipoprotein EscJ
MGVIHGSAVLSGIKRLVKNAAKSLDLNALEVMANRCYAPWVEVLNPFCGKFALRPVP